MLVAALVERFTAPHNDIPFSLFPPSHLSSAYVPSASSSSSPFHDSETKRGPCRKKQNRKRDGKTPTISLLPPPPAPLHLPPATFLLLRLLLLLFRPARPRPNPPMPPLPNPPSTYDAHNQQRLYGPSRASLSPQRPDNPSYNLLTTHPPPTSYRDAHGVGRLLLTVRDGARMEVPGCRGPGTEV